jgi:hypothetical protein
VAGIFASTARACRRGCGRRRAARIKTHVAAAALAGTVAMLAGGLFEYNFGDSEFLMLFLLIATLPFVPQRQTSAAS